MQRIPELALTLNLHTYTHVIYVIFLDSSGPPDAPAGWIWFNVSSLQPSMLAAELVLFRKTLHPRPVSVTVTLHGVTAPEAAHRDSPALEERLLKLEQRPASGYDVFDVSPLLARRPLEAVGFQLQYTDESGSLVLHEALTQSLYALTRGLQTEPLLVLYQRHRHNLELDSLGLQ